MPLARKRPSEPNPQEDPEDDSPEPATQRRRTNNNSDASNDASDDDDDSSSSSSDSEAQAPSSADVMVKKLVRLALGSEYSRLPIRRTDIATKVLGEQGARPFKGVFESAQKVLRRVFGMEMVEMPQKEKATISQRKAAQKVEKPSTSNKAWILCSTLPQMYRTPEILPPTKAPSSALESSYTGLYTFIISLVLLNGGSVAEQKLERYLKRTNTDTYTPIDRTDRFLQRLCKEGYLVRNREMDGGEEVIEYMVGPRGKAEVGTLGAAGLVREVYGRQGAAEDMDDLTPAERDKKEEFERRLERSLGLKRRVVTAATENGEQAENPENGEDEAPRRRQSRGQRQEDDENSD